MKQIAVGGTLFLLLSGTVGAQTNASASAKPADEALRYERAGEPLKAAAVYERMAREDRAKRSVVAHRLVRLYTEQKRPRDVLRWVREIMKNHPDPHAYHAGVLATIGRHAEAEAILRKELAKAATVQRKIVLRWQLADCLAKQEKGTEAEEVLREALRIAEGSVHEAAARRKLGMMLKR